MIDLIGLPNDDLKKSLGGILRTVGVMRSYPTPVAVEGLRLETIDEVIWRS